jgi:hypothetical protein
MQGHVEVFALLADAIYAEQVMRRLLIQELPPQ